MSTPTPAQWLGLGVAASGFISGFASSTATVAALRSRARHHAEWLGLLATGAVLSTAATWVQVMLMAGVLVAISANSVTRCVTAWVAGV